MEKIRGFHPSDMFVVEVDWHTDRLNLLRRNSIYGNYEFKNSIFGGMDNFRREYMLSPPSEEFYYDTEMSKDESTTKKLLGISRSLGKTEMMWNIINEYKKNNSNKFFVDSMTNIKKTVKKGPEPLLRPKYEIKLEEVRDLSKLSDLILELSNKNYNQRTLIESIGVYVTKHNDRYFTVEFDEFKLMTDLKLPESFNEMVDKLNEYIMTKNYSHK